jgi:hypothetical protein
MSYCGACGNFYFPDCPRRADGTCAPAANPFDVRLAEIRFLTVMAEISLSAMRAENDWRLQQDQSLAYGEADFIAVADKLRKEVEMLQ